MSPLAAALSAVTESLRRCGVAPITFAPSCALHRLEYDLDGDTIAAVGWADGMFVDPDIPPELAALIRSHADLACSAPPTPVPLVPTCPPGCSGRCSHPYLED